MNNPREPMETHHNFKAGDIIPAWVLKAPSEDMQHLAVFVTNVAVTRFDDGAVSVRQMSPGEYMAEIIGGSSGVWQGAPTEWLQWPSDINAELARNQVSGPFSVSPAAPTTEPR